MNVRTLIVEDSMQDAELIEAEFGLAGIDCTSIRVEDAHDFRQELLQGQWDLVLCDYRMPRFSAIEALEIWRKVGKDVPFIIVSGAIGEREAIEVMRRGARDFVHKDNLSRLIPVVHRELGEAAVRRERELTRAELERLRARNELILKSVIDGVIGLDETGTITFVNPAAEELLGYGSAELIGKNMHHALHSKFADGSSYPTEACPIEQAREMGVLHRTDKEVLWRKNGASFPVEYSTNPLREGGRIMGAVVVFRDVTEKKRNEEQREKAIQARDQVLAMVSHDLKSPLSGIDLNASLLIRRLNADIPKAFLSQRLASIRDSASRMNRLISDLLDVTRIEAGRLVIHAAIQEAADLIGRAVRDIHMLVESKGVELKVDLKKTGEFNNPKVVCDPERILQVFANLLGNAVKFVNERGGKVVLGVEELNSEIVFVVADNGPGIPAEELVHVFDRFWHSRRSRQAGTGLGLAIVEGIVRAHMGRIWVESEVGRGATFRFSVPKADSKKGRALLECDEYGRSRGQQPRAS